MGAEDPYIPSGQCRGLLRPGTAAAVFQLDALGTRRARQPIVEGDEANGFSELILQVLTARELGRIAGAQCVCPEQGASANTYGRRQLDDQQRREVRTERRKNTITVTNRKRPFSRAPRYRGCDLDFREPARRGRP